MLLLYEIGLVASWLTHREEGNYFADLPMVQTLRQVLGRIYKAVRSGVGWLARKVRWAIGLTSKGSPSGCREDCVVVE